MKIALVLGSGGARGYAHIGVIDELLHRGHEIVSVSGCSMGALVGGMYAAGALEEFREFVMPLRRSEVFRYADITMSGPGLFKTDRLMDRLHSIVGDVRIEDLGIPFTAVATDLTNRREVWFHDGPLLTAVRASVAIPTAITPVVYRDRLLADGGILNPLPVDASSHFLSEATVAVSLFGRNRPGLGQQTVNPGMHTEQGPESQNARLSDTRTFSGVASHGESGDIDADTAAADNAAVEAADQAVEIAEATAVNVATAGVAAVERLSDGVAETDQATEGLPLRSEPSDASPDGSSGASPDASAAFPATSPVTAWRERFAQGWRDQVSSRAPGHARAVGGGRRGRETSAGSAGTPVEPRRPGARGSGKGGAQWSAGFTSLPKDLSTVDMMVSALEVMQTAIELPRLAVQPPDVLVSVPSDVCGTFDFERAEEIIAVGRRLAVEALDRAGL